MKKIGMISLGCSKNLVDAEVMLGILSKEGYSLINEPQQADVLIVNTCGFIESAKKESIDSIIEMAEYKKSGNCSVLIVSGCMAERYREEILTELPEVDGIIGVGSYGDIAKIVERCQNEHGVMLMEQSTSNETSKMPRVRTTANHTAYLKIAEGCDNHCTYCVIPSIRGKYVSREIDDIFDEACALVSDGAKELIIIAQDTTRYGIDIYKKKMLSALLDKLCTIDGLCWIRLHYCYPEAIDDELIDCIVRQQKVLNYLDIPVQHCSDSILKLMGRKSSKAELVRLFAKLRDKLPNVVLRTSIIVGFPGETDGDFLQLCDFVRDIKFDRMGVFTYSKEEGTPAEKMPNQIDESTKQDRHDMLMGIQSEISKQKNIDKIGLIFSVLVEGYDFESFQYYGRSYADSIDIDGTVYFFAQDEVAVGSIVDVEIQDADEYDIYGVLA